MVPLQVRRCSIINEFSGEQQHQMFDVSVNKTLHHIDTLYYSVMLNEPEDIVKLQRDNDLPENLLRFLQFLRNSKDSICDYTSDPPKIGELEMTLKSFSMYEYCLSLNECFDIFISSFLPTDETPRVVVQLRSRYLVLEGAKKAVEKSYDCLREFLSPFGLLPVRVRENRIDYAFHTNLIQDPYAFFSDERLMKHLKSNLHIYQKIGRNGSKITVDTFNLGNRKSNNVYFRAYNKVREVIEMNYKSFFITRWRENGLISEFDRYVYEYAYKLKAYRSGILMGRMKWYLEFGSNDEIKQLCRNLIATNFINSDNLDAIEKSIHGIIPEPTLILNIEYQCKRKFFLTCREWLRFRTDLPFCWKDHPSSAVDVNVPYPHLCDPLLSDLYGILFSSRDIIDYLTGFGNCVSFVTDRSMSYRQFKEQGEPYMYWWKRIRSTPIDYSHSTILELYRKYDINVSREKTRRSLEGQIARLSMLKNNDVENRSFIEDMTDVLCVLNDNDVVPKFVPNDYIIESMVDENGTLDLYKFDPKEYSEIRMRKARQLRGILHKGNVEQKNKNENTSEEAEEKEGKCDT